MGEARSLLFDAPADGLRYRVYCRAFAGASAIHLLLPDALDPDWLLPDAAYWLGALLLAHRGSLAGWVLSALGLAWPLLFLGDQLTQSAFLLGCAAAAVGCFAGPREGRRRRLEESLPLAIGVLTIGVYGIAAVHKLNRDFFDPAVSCANGGLAILADNWAIDALLAPGVAHLWPPLFLAAELTTALLLAVRPAYGMALAVAMHIPLTIVFAPSFAFVMMSGWTCLLSERELAHLLSVLRRRWRLIIGLGATLGAASFGLYMVRHWVVYPWWSFKEAVLWTVLVWLLVALSSRPEGLFRASFVGTSRSRHALGLAFVVGLMWLANGLSPYAGLRFHHSGAMLSNLRIDEGCWNSLLFPEALRGQDPYLRIDEVEIGGDVPGREALETQLRSRLFDRRTFEESRREACDHGAAPLRIEGTYGGERFTISNACAAPYPLGEPLLSRARAFQRNIERGCPQTCIH